MSIFSFLKKKKTEEKPLAIDQPNESAYVGRVEHSRRFWLNTRVAQIGQSRRRNWTVPSSRLYIDTNQVIAYAQIAFTRCGG
jgi:hypothetical protein